MPRSERANRVSVLWSVSDELSAAHATYIVATGGQCNDPKLEALLIDFVVQINTRLATESLEMGPFWNEYIRQIASRIPVANATKASLAFAGCSELQLDQTAGAIAKRLSDAREVYLRRFPRLVEQLELRGQPLRQQWDSFGAGLLLQMEKLVRDPAADQAFWSNRVQAHLIQPSRGGDGGWDADAELIWIEAMLTDADPLVPEVLRVAWLMLGLGLDLRAGDRKEASDRDVRALASVPVVLTAGMELGLCQSEPLPIETAMRLWGIGSPASAKKVRDWWNDCSDAKTPWIDSLDELTTRLSLA
ncbi:hypothetical protein Pla22_49350 [Rubripirellula amarantea]|uniref:Uncharacterized protein n=1 Tax=Rubripirellula amarantea TaxID=2527999 RepID=A0A5C5WG39_9BACT|nr:hypothetical protein [Rubripirellula amarantea]TWT49734.1 hypothetical protein Pla22_49350 [Rubripirellula amarantea]